MSEPTKYFNFPISLLQGFLDNKNKCLLNILDYAIYTHANNNVEEEEFLEAEILESLEYFSVNTGSIDSLIANGENLYYSNTSCKVITGINTSIFWDYKTNHKSKFEDVVLLAYLSLRSIVQKKAYCKVTNLFLLSRMDGHSSSVTEGQQLSDKIKVFNNEYQIKKIKAELSDNWGLVHYGRYTRGFYVSFTMELEDLIYQVEKKRKSRKLKQQKNERKNALENALKRLEQDDEATK
tara:strand:- start:6212 stop:6922 length:711 start_codon:yes stop_codon:yes gene_type:complete